LKGDEVKMYNAAKIFPLRLSIDFHEKIKQAAAEEHVSLHEYVMKAVNEKLQQTSKKVS
jgi:predicted HicB family RNase H-like nuclease